MTQAQPSILSVGDAEVALVGTYFTMLHGLPLFSRLNAGEVSDDDEVKPGSAWFMVYVAP